MMRVISLSFIISHFSFSEAQTPVYLDETKPVEQRIDDALQRMTLDEKIRVIHAQSKFSSRTDYVSFAENACIAVELGARSPRAIIGSDDPYLVKWGNATPPGETTKFSLSVNGEILAQYRLRADATGLQLGYTPGTLMIVR